MINKIYILILIIILGLILGNKYGLNFMPEMFCNCNSTVNGGVGGVGVMEGFVNTDIRSGGYLKPGEANGSYQLNAPYNYTQGEFVKLTNVLEKMPTRGCMSGVPKAVLKYPQDYFVLKPETMEPEFKVQLDKISRVVLRRLNRLFNEPGYVSTFELVDYDNVGVAHDGRGNLHFIYDMNVIERQRNFEKGGNAGMLPHSVRLRVDVIKPSDKMAGCAEGGCPGIREELNSNWRMIKYLENIQGKRRLASFSLGGDNSGEHSLFFPSPLQALSTPHWPVLDTVNWQSPSSSTDLSECNGDLEKQLVINGVRLYNSDLIINPDAPVGVVPGGVNDNRLEFSCYMNARNYKALPNVIANKWIPLADEPTCLKGYPCVPESQCWDKLGVKRRIGEEKDGMCNGLRHSTTMPPVQAEFNPTIHTNPRNEGIYSWLFDLYRQGGDAGRNFAY